MATKKYRLYNDAFSNELFIFVSNTIFAGQDYKENEPFSQDNLQADYTETLDGVLDFAYRDILLEEILAGRIENCLKRLNSTM